VLSFSFGAAHFTRWAGSNPSLCSQYNIVGMVALSHGFSAQETSEAGAKSLGGAPGRTVVELWKEDVTSKANLEQLKTLDGTNGFKMQQLLKATTFEQWDDALLPLYGYDNAQDMLKECDAVYVLQDLNIPMLFLNAENDPVCPAQRMRRIEHPQLLNHRLAVLVSTRFGGHLHWPDGCCYSRASWILRVVLEYIHAILCKCTPLMQKE